MNSKQDENRKISYSSSSFKYKNILLIAVYALLFILFLNTKSYGKGYSKNKVTVSDPVLEETVIVSFGRYEQDGNLENGPEPIEWIVLGVEDNKALLLSKYILAYRPMHSIREEYDWRDTELREWLEEEFFAKAFTMSEKRKMLRIELSSKDLHNRSISLSDNSFSSMSENPFLYKLLGAKDYQAPEGILNFVICPDQSEIEKMKKFKATTSIPALKNDCKSYWLRNWSSRTMYESPVTYYRCISSSGKEDSIRAETYNGVRPEIMIKIDELEKLGK